MNKVNNHNRFISISGNRNLSYYTLLASEKYQDGARYSNAQVILFVKRWWSDYLGSLSTDQSSEDNPIVSTTFTQK
ncbi:hypothetical protein MSj_02151 [Microcystis aeruginosa Sj]|uniref:Uncharacterized protein n=1 Tax=Microcystis aeruginosa Sj TaxID=1979544 RepID=A0A2Z6UMP4_MICAE|nr:hypothetical protein MSj_02151 [Microcystis aeruginosa Sj]